jgi:predicted nucleic acid-binding protein
VPGVTDVEGAPEVRVSLDAAPVIYAVEQVPGFGAAVDARLAAPGVVPVTSELTRLECRVKPLREEDAALLGDFDAFFADAAVVVALTREVIDRATELRARYGVRTPDAIHLAAAVASGCDVFLTNDRRLAHVPGIPVEVVTPGPPPPPERAPA